MQKKIGKIAPYIYILPIFIVSGVFLYYSIFFTIYASFQKWDGISSHMTFIGLGNYKQLFSSGVIFTALKNNLIFFVLTVALQAGIGLLIAVLLRAKLRGHSIFKMIFFLPVVMAPIIISAIFRIILDPNIGSLNEILRALHLSFLARSWLANPHIALFSITAVNIFEWMGFSMLIYYGALLAIPDEIYEAARIDGAGFWKTLVGITVPMVKSTTSTLIVLGIVGSLKTFDIVFLLTKGGPGHSTEFLTTYLYKEAIQNFNGGVSSAIGVIILIVALTMSIIQIKMNQKSEAKS